MPLTKREKSLPSGNPFNDWHQVAVTSMGEANSHLPYPSLELYLISSTCFKAPPSLKPNQTLGLTQPGMDSWIVPTPAGGENFGIQNE